jgi:hypothetical protein
MEMPSVVHPVTFEIDGYLFRVTSYTSLTDDQAAAIAKSYYHQLRSKRKLKKKDIGCTFDCITLFDADSSSLL